MESNLVFSFLTSTYLHIRRSSLLSVDIEELTPSD